MALELQAENLRYATLMAWVSTSNAVKLIVYSMCRYWHTIVSAPELICTKPPPSGI